jgi:hypothetical protein
MVPLLTPLFFGRSYLKKVAENIFGNVLTIEKYPQSAVA